MAFGRSIKLPVASRTWHCSINPHRPTVISVICIKPTRKFGTLFSSHQLCHEIFNNVAECHETRHLQRKYSNIFTSPRLDSWNLRLRDFLTTLHGYRTRHLKLIVLSLNNNVACRPGLLLKTFSSTDNCMLQLQQITFNIGFLDTTYYKFFYNTHLS